MNTFLRKEEQFKLTRRQFLFFSAIGGVSTLGTYAFSRMGIFSKAYANASSTLKFLSPLEHQVLISVADVMLPNSPRFPDGPKTVADNIDIFLSSCDFELVKDLKTVLSSFGGFLGPIFLFGRFGRFHRLNQEDREARLRLFQNASKTERLFLNKLSI